MGKAIGIDLGTTNSAAAIIEGGKPRLITYHGGSTTMPSVFAIDEQGRELVGHEARRQAQLNPQNTVQAVKRLIGRNYHSKVIDRIRQIFTYELVEGDDSEVLVRVNEKIFTLEQISAAILSRIKEFATEALGEEADQAVITVPAYFNDRQRQAVRKAGQMAGFKVLRILNEPTAAALAYGMGKTLNQRIAVYDLGGGTFDISVIDIKERVFEVVATGGDTFLGGVDFDSRVMQWVLERFHEKHGIDLSYDRVAVQRIRDASEAAKIELSTLKETRIHIPFITQGEHGPLDVDEVLTRAKLEELTEDLVDRTLETCRRIFREAATDIDQVDEILLVGGQSRMPLVQRKVAEMMGKQPSKGVHPDEAVSIGAAIMAHSLSARESTDVTLLDVLPMAIGIGKLDGTMSVLFEKNRHLPDYETRTLTTSKDNQRSIMLRIYQGESRYVAENELLGTFVFSGIRRAPKGQVQIKVTFHIDSEGILNLTAKDKATGQTVATRLKLSKKGRKPAKPAGKPGGEPPAAAAGKAEEKGEAASPGFKMPTSSLAREISGGARPEAEATVDSGPTGAEKAEEKPAEAEKEKPATGEKAEEKPAEAEKEKPATGEKAEEKGGEEPAKTEGEKPRKKGSLWSRVKAWFSGFFGG